jgi:staphylococcal nuclease domain-containing protein 1
VLVGKTVQFRIDHTSPSNHNFATLVLQQPIDGDSDVSTILVKAGWAKAKSMDGKRATEYLTVNFRDLEKLNQLQLEAKADGLGLWSEKPFAPRTVLQTLEEDPRQFLAKNKGKKIPGQCLFTKL